ncbi:MAG: hypothetical protein JNK12_11005 [Acidimicrobiales bacterium]|nr:hypothetical protein [Acidimicrobiales bacterium]
MQRLFAVLLMTILVAVLGVGLVTWRADEAARADRRELLCLERVQATAAAAALVPNVAVDEQGRLDAARTLGDRVEAC